MTGMARMTGMTGMPGMTRMTWRWGDEDDWYDRYE